MLALIRGAGDLATGVALRLFRSGIDVAMTDLPQPLAIRRTVAFSEAVRLGRTVVEDVEAVRVADAAQARRAIAGGAVPVLADPECRCLDALSPDAVVDAVVAKRNLGTTIDMAPVVVAVGPGFTAGVDCHAVVESMRGHTLGRVYYTGSALPNTAIPGFIGGFAGERVLRAPATGTFRAKRSIGDLVECGEVVGHVGEKPLACTVGGVLRGLVADGTFVTEGLKVGDVDPRGDASFCFLASEKALAVGGGVLEAILNLSAALR